MSFLVVGGCTGGYIARQHFLEKSETGVWEKRSLDRGSFGSLTSSYGIFDGDTVFVIDNGLGVANVSDVILERKPREVIVLQTHLHADHIEGLQANGVFFSPVELVLYLPFRKSAYQLFEERLGREYWPVVPNIDDISVSNVSVSDNSTREYRHFDYLRLVNCLPLPHPSPLSPPPFYPPGSFAYKITLASGKSVVIATDCELTKEDDQRKLAEFIYGTDVFLVDCQFRDCEYFGEVGVAGRPAQSYGGWGHSIPTMINDVLKNCTNNPPKLILGTHHDSRRNTDDLQRFEREFQESLVEIAPNSKIRFARECEIIPL